MCYEYFKVFLPPLFRSVCQLFLHYFLSRYFLLLVLKNPKPTLPQLFTFLFDTPSPPLVAGAPVFLPILVAKTSCTLRSHRFSHFSSPADNGRNVGFFFFGGQKYSVVKPIPPLVLSINFFSSCFDRWWFPLSNSPSMRIKDFILRLKRQGFTCFCRI